MITVRKSEDRGHVDHGWLKTHHTFSFGDYYDPKHNNFLHLRVINEDFVDPGQGFGSHPHRDMEIITYIVEGELEHKDSMGTGSVIKRGDIQAMSAGTGVFHSEFNPSKTKAVHLLQIWVLPEKKDLKPEYQQKHFSDSEKKNKLCELIGDGESSIKVHQDVKLFASLLDKNKTAEYRLASGRFGWLQVISGSIDLNGVILLEGDAAAVSKETLLSIEAKELTEFLLFDLA
jgi:redox-sensitive bicupin YhaK (pirin superfamily)